MCKRLVALLGCLLVLVFAGSALAHAQPAPTFWSITMVPSVTEYGGKSHLTASLFANGRLAAAGGIALQRSFDGSTWTTAGTMFSQTGTYTCDVTVIERMMYRLVYRGDGLTLAPSKSATRTVTSRAYLTAPSVAGRVYKGKALSTIGYLKPRHAAGTQWVTLEAQQFVRGAWKPIKTYGTATADNYSYSKYTQSIVLPYTGSWRIRAVHADGNHAKTVTGWSYTTVLPDPTIRLSGKGPLSAQFRLKKGGHKVQFTCAPDNSLPVGFFWVDRVWTGSLNGHPMRAMAPLVSLKSTQSSGSTSFYLAADTLTTFSVQASAMTWTLTVTND